MTARYFSHIRDEGDPSTARSMKRSGIGREARIPINIWHLKIGGRPNWGRMPISAASTRRGPRGSMLRRMCIRTRHRRRD
jgi:hypothetical protein